MNGPRTRRGTRREAKNSEETEHGKRVSRSETIPGAAAVAGRHSKNYSHASNGVSTRRLRSIAFQHKNAKTRFRNGTGQTVAPKIDGDSDLDKKMPAKTHNTRLRNGINKQKRTVSIPKFWWASPYT